MAYFTWYFFLLQPEYFQLNVQHNSKLLGTVLVLYRTVRKIAKSWAKGKLEHEMNDCSLRAKCSLVARILLYYYWTKWSYTGLVPS
jgi:hypothetical protein